jgi:hypothetical protein
MVFDEFVAQFGQSLPNALPAWKYRAVWSFFA